MLSKIIYLLVTLLTIYIFSLPNDIFVFYSSFLFMLLLIFHIWYLNTKENLYILEYLDYEKKSIIKYRKLNNILYHSLNILLIQLYLIVLFFLIKLILMFY